jgi:hypothetical protein
VGQVMAVFGDDQVTAMGRRAVEFEALLAWNAAEVTGRAGACGTPFGLASRKFAGRTGRCVSALFRRVRDVR